MTSGDRVSEIIKEGRDKASSAAKKAGEATKSADFASSGAGHEAQEASGPYNLHDVNEGGVSYDGDLKAPQEAGEIILPGRLNVQDKADQTKETDLEDMGEERADKSTDEVINGCGRHIKDSFLSGLKNRKTLATAGIMGIIWLVISLLPAIGFNPLPVQVLSTLTFAQGGLTGGGPGFIGGIIGKGLIAYFVTLVITGKISPESISSSLRYFTAKFSGRGLDDTSIPPLLIGIGAALLIYNFLAGTSTIFNVMVGIVAFIVAVRSLSGKSGCVRRITASLFAKNGCADSGLITKIMTGWAAGFGLGVGLSLFGVFLGGYICYIAGIAILLAGAGWFYSNERKGGTPI